MILLTMARPKMLLSPETDRMPSFMTSSPSVINRNILNVQVNIFYVEIFLMTSQSAIT